MLYKDYGRKYKVSIQFNPEMLNKQEVRALVQESFSVDEIISLNDYFLETVLEVPANEGLHEIENDLFYILECGDLGSYSIEYLQ